VAFAGHAAAGLMIQPAAYSAGNIDALVVSGWADQNFSTDLTKAATQENVTCASGGENKDGSPGYVATPPADLGYQRAYFADTDPRVLAAARNLLTLGPCGEPQSALATIGADQAYLRDVRLPVLLVYGTKDGFFDDPRAAGASQRGLYSSSPDATLAFIEGAGNALALERSAPRFRALVSDWLEARGY
jgi:pimeloyl-ACP methyl ester carboxylesterase